MEKKTIIAGFGGQGVMLIGQLLGYAATYAGKHATYYPSYGPEMRGGTANCTVVISDNTVGTPIPDQVDVLIAMNTPSLKKFEDKVIAGGTIILNSSIVDTDVDRTDVKVIKVPANKVANEIGTVKAANMVILGSFIKSADVLTKEQIFETMEVKMASKARFFNTNKIAIETGMEIAAKG